MSLALSQTDIRFLAPHPSSHLRVSQADFALGVLRQQSALSFQATSSLVYFFLLNS